MKIKLKKKYVTRFRIVKSGKQDPWGVRFFLRRRFFLRSLYVYYKKIQDMRRKKNFTNVLLLDKSRGKIKKRVNRKSLYGKMLINKQRLQKFYNVFTSKKLRRLVRKFSGLGSNTGIDNILSFLELRLDNLLRRSYFVPTIHWARQVIVHGKFDSEKNFFYKPSVLFNVGQDLCLHRKLPHYYNIISFFRRLKKNLKPLPNYLLVDYKTMRFFVTCLPKLNNVFYSFKGNFTNLVQFYQNRK